MWDSCSVGTRAAHHRPRKRFLRHAPGSRRSRPSLRLDGTPLEWREVEELVRESNRLVMPKRLQRALDVEPERTRRK